MPTNNHCELRRKDRRRSSSETLALLLNTSLIRSCNGTEETVRKWEKRRKRRGKEEGKRGVGESQLKFICRFSFRHGTGAHFQNSSHDWQNSAQLSRDFKKRCGGSAGTKFWLFLQLTPLVELWKEKMADPVFKKFLFLILHFPWRLRPVAPNCYL